MADIKDITKDSFDKAVLQDQNLLMVYYYAAWCKQCQEMEEVLEAIAVEVKDKMGVVRVNTDTEGEVVQQQKIPTIPFYQVFQAGKSIESFRGKRSKLEMLGQLSQIITESGSDAPRPMRPEKP